MALDHDYLRYYKIKEGAKVLDLGATTGEFAEAFYKDLRQNGCLYIAVEPSLWNIRFLSNHLNTLIPWNSLLISGAVTDKDGVVEFFVSHSNVLHTTSKDVQGWGQSYYDRNIEFPSRTIIQSLSLNTVVDMFGGIDFIKCDIEGAELDVFRTFTKWDKIHSMAIAAYHIINDKQTVEVLQPIFEQSGFNTSYEEGILYATRNEE